MYIVIALVVRACVRTYVAPERNPKHIYVCTCMYIVTYPPPALALILGMSISPHKSHMQGLHTNPTEYV